MGCIPSDFEPKHPFPPSSRFGQILAMAVRKAMVQKRKGVLHHMLSTEPPTIYQRVTGVDDDVTAGCDSMFAARPHPG